MDITHALALALIQGLTEFLPISSSAHLILPFTILGWPDQGLAFDTAVHLGTLVAVLWFFRHDLARLGGALITCARARQSTPDSRFALNLLIASLPIIPAGLLAQGLVEGSLRSLDVIIWTTVLFGILLYVADKAGRRTRSEAELTWQQALTIGLAQCIALIPGVSRSGITITAALLTGFNRESASRISFLLSIPAIAGAGTLKLFDLINGDAVVDWIPLGVGFVASAVSAYLCIRWFLACINRMGFTPFVVYRVLLGAVLFTFFA